MTEKKRTYIAIDLKSFYASVECKERNRDPLTTNLVVADKSRTEVSVSHIGQTCNDKYRKCYIISVSVKKR